MLKHLFDLFFEIKNMNLVIVGFWWDLWCGWNEFLSQRKFFSRIFMEKNVFLQKEPAWNRK